MSILDQRNDYLENPFFVKHEKGDFTPFYIAIAICSVIGGFLFILNIAFCCSRHRSYWQNRHTGNRWIQSLWTVLPYKIPPLDLSELESGTVSFQKFRPKEVRYQHPESQPGTPQPQEYMEMQKPVACLTMFVLGVIMIIIKYGPRLCNVRHHPLPSDLDWEAKSYSRKLSVSTA